MDTGSHFRFQCPDNPCRETFLDNHMAEILHRGSRNHTTAQIQVLKTISEDTDKHGQNNTFGQRQQEDTTREEFLKLMSKRGEIPNMVVRQNRITSIIAKLRILDSKESSKTKGR